MINCNINGPIKLVSVNKKATSTYNDSINVGWINAVVTALLNRTLAVAQKTSVSNPYIKTQPNNNEFKNKSRLKSLESIPPAMIIASLEHSLS